MKTLPLYVKTYKSQIKTLFIEDIKFDYVLPFNKFFFLKKDLPLNIFLESKFIQTLRIKNYYTLYYTVLILK